MVTSDKVKAQWGRLLWHLNRSPLRRIVKAGLRLVHRSEVEYRRRLAADVPCDSRLARHAEDLSANGYAKIDDVVDRALLEELAGASDLKLAKVGKVTLEQRLTHKSFWTRLLDEDMRDGALPAQSPFVRFALQAPVVSILCRALGEVPRLDYVLLTLSGESSDSYSYSQLWHRDYDDVRTIKLFVYFTNVEDARDGPFTFIPGPVSDRLGFSLRSHRPDSALFAEVDPKEAVAIIAPRLSVFIVETSRCLHMGSRVMPGHQRLLYTATFLTAPRMYPEPPPCFILTGGEDAVSRCLMLPYQSGSQYV